MRNVRNKSKSQASYVLRGSNEPLEILPSSKGDLAVLELTEKLAFLGPSLIDLQCIGQYVSTARFVVYKGGEIL